VMLVCECFAVVNRYFTTCYYNILRQLIEYFDSYFIYIWCLSMYLSIYNSICIYIAAYTYTSTFTCKYRWLYKYLCVYVHMYNYIKEYASSMYMYKWIWMYVCMHRWKYLYVTIYRWIYIKRLYIYSAGYWGFYRAFCCEICLTKVQETLWQNSWPMTQKFCLAIVANLQANSYTNYMITNMQTYTRALPDNICEIIC
jgi:hypothetical protein